MRVTIDGKEFEIDWKHSVPQRAYPLPGECYHCFLKEFPRRMSRGNTSCHVYSVEGRSLFPAVVGVARLHPNDVYNKEKGRLVSLEKVCGQLSRYLFTIEGGDVLAMEHRVHCLVFTAYRLRNSKSEDGRNKE